MQDETQVVLQDATLLERYTAEYTKILIDYSPKLISAIIIMIVCHYTIKFINSFARKIMAKKDFEPTLSNFLADILNWLLKVMLFVMVISKLGIESTSFVAILGAGSLAIGLSLQGSLSNFAGGILIVLFKPFKVGDTIEAQGSIGTVSEIQIFVTKLITGNNHTIFIPNGSLSNGTIINYSAQGTRRADQLFSVSYSTDLKLAKEIIMNVMKSNPKVLQNPEPAVVVTELTDSAVKLSIRPWATTADFGSVSADTLENCKIELFKAGIDIQPSTKQSNV